MTLEEIKKALKTKEYEFLVKDKHLGNNIILLSLGGSHAYGTNVPTSDLDIRGIAIEQPNEIVGLSTFEQVLEKNTDTTIFAFRKICKLLMSANPNIIEILGLKDEHYLYVSELGQKILDNIDLFLSKEVFHTFRGYAKSNLDRLENALCRDELPEDMKVRHIKRSIDSAIEDHNSKHTPKIKLSHIKINRDNELVVNLKMKKWPVSELRNWYNSVITTLNNYNSVLNRNRKKDELHLNKHAMHLIRLYLMCIDILEGKGVKTYRDNDIELLMKIRDGEYMKDGILSKDFYDMMAKLEEKCQKAFKNSKLPDKVDYNKLEKFITEVSIDIVNGKYKSDFVNWYNNVLGQEEVGNSKEIANKCDKCSSIGRL